MVRDLLKSADIAVANFENPAPNAFRWHTKGTVFSADPKLIAGLRNAGIDVVSLGNNHIRDAGAQGIIDTIRNLEKYGLKHTGAGANLVAARRPAIVTTHGVKVAILGYDAIARYYAAGPSRAGRAHPSLAAVQADVAGPGVPCPCRHHLPHWGRTPRPSAAQRRLARATLADMIIGNHAHWARAIDPPRPADLVRARQLRVRPGLVEQTMEDHQLTFHGSTLVQARIRPPI